MQFMMIVKATAESEAGVMPKAEQILAMQKYNEELVKAGVLLAADGIHSSAKGARVYFDGDKKTVVDGPFTARKELISGFWIIQAKSLEGAVEWARRAPNPQLRRQDEHRDPQGDHHGGSRRGCHAGGGREPRPDPRRWRRQQGR